MTGITDKEAVYPMGNGLFRSVRAFSLRRHRRITLYRFDYLQPILSRHSGV
jgi:hypothetical protein